MFGTHDLQLFLLASLVLWITPGPDTMFILAQGVSRGTRMGVISVLGLSTGALLHTMFVALGLSTFLLTSEIAFDVVKTAGALYLIYLGYHSIRTRPTAEREVRRMSSSNWDAYRRGIASNVLNPKVAIFFLAFLPQFVDANANLGVLPFFYLGGLFVFGGTLWMLVVALCASQASRVFRKNRDSVVWLERFAGCVYVGLGLKLLRSRA